jgi:hypothetical protein
VYEMSPGERALLRFRWFVYDAGSRPLVVAAVLVMLAVIAAMAASVVSASVDSFGGFRQWVSFASTGFRIEVQLGVLVAAVLLVVDALTGKAFPGQQALLGLLVVVATAGVVANVGNIVAWLPEVGRSAAPEGTTIEAWTVIIATYLAPTVLAIVSAWMALRGIRPLGNPRGVHDEL